MPNKRMDALERTALTIKSVSDYQSGASIREIANKYGYSYKTINDLLKQAKVEMRPKGRPPMEY